MQKMSERSLCFSLPLLIREIDNFFENYPDHTYKNFFAVSELRHKLASYMLDRIFDASAAHNDRGQRSIVSKFSHRCLEQQLQMEVWIQAGMMHVLQEGCATQRFPHHFAPTQHRST
jgi:hypothetical protein